MDIFKNLMWYSYVNEPLKFIEIKVERVNDIISMNKKGKNPSDLMDFVEVVEEIKLPDYANVVGQDSLTRFDNPNKHKKHKKNKHRKHKKSNNQNK